MLFICLTISSSSSSSYPNNLNRKNINKYFKKLRIDVNFYFTFYLKFRASCIVIGFTTLFKTKLDHSRQSFFNHMLTCSLKLMLQAGVSDLKDKVQSSIRKSQGLLIQAEDLLTRSIQGQWVQLFPPFSSNCFNFTLIIFSCNSCDFAIIIAQFFNLIAFSERPLTLNEKLKEGCYETL